MGTGNRVGIGVSYRPARLHRLAESIPGLLKSLKILAQKVEVFGSLPLGGGGGGVVEGREGHFGTLFCLSYHFVLHYKFMYVELSSC
jgi:hypothetical protein